MAQRIRARAITRASDIYMQIEAGTKHNAKKQNAANDTLLSRTDAYTAANRYGNSTKEGDCPSSRKEAARNAGMSEHQQKQAGRAPKGRGRSKQGPIQGGGGK